MQPSDAESTESYPCCVAGEGLRCQILPCSLLPRSELCIPAGKETEPPPHSAAGLNPPQRPLLLPDRSDLGRYQRIILWGGIGKEHLPLRRGLRKAEAGDFPPLVCGAFQAKPAGNCSFFGGRRMVQEQLNPESSVAAEGKEEANQAPEIDLLNLQLLKSRDSFSGCLENKSKAEVPRTGIQGIIPPSVPICIQNCV